MLWKVELGLWMKLLYLVDDSKSVISIIHVVYGKRDLDKVLAD